VLGDCQLIKDPLQAGLKMPVAGVVHNVHVQLYIHVRVKADIGADMQELGQVIGLKLCAVTQMEGG
jgi:hypothetical protein